MKKNVVKKILIGVIFSIIVLILSAMLFLTIAYHKLDLNINKLTDVNSGVKIYSSSYLNENETFSYNSDRKIINISDLKPWTINAFIDIEDQHFYSHNGYDLKRIFKSMLVNIKEHSKSQGASTITQQLIKNTMLSNEKTYKRKLNEIILAIKTEKAFSKDEIMNMYLNTIYFGSNAYGIESASQIYFNKSAKDLTLNESAILAGLIKSPRTYSPRLNPNDCYERKNLVLKQMLKNNHITQEEYDLTSKLSVQCCQNLNSYDNSYYQQAIFEACKLLNISEKQLIRNNYQIITFLDKNLQSKLQDIYSNSNLDCDKLSIISTNEGEVIAYLGNSYYDLSNMNFMPASTLKPFSVYLPSIEHNMLYTSTPVLDEETSFSGYKPQNVGGAYHGWISAKEALSKSLNIPAVKFLSYLGVEKSINFLNKIGIKTSENDHNLALALGGLTNGVSAFDLIEAYSVLQNSGIKTNCRFVDKILDENGKIIYQNNKKSTKICDPEDAYLVTDMLTETVKTGTAKKLSDFNFDIASKTGTNSLDDKNLDLYNISYTTDRILFTWLGDATREGIENLSSSFHATSINKEILTEIYKDYQPKSFEVPENIVEKEIDLLEYEVNHKVILASEYTPDRYKLKQKFKLNHQPIEDSSLYQSPNLDFSLELTDKGADINLNTKEIFNYTIKKVSNGKEEILADFSNLNNQQTIQDEKVFCYDKISYQIIAKNKYNNQIYYSEIKEVYPKEFLISRLKNQENIYKINTKKRWFV